MATFSTSLFSVPRVAGLTSLLYDFFLSPFPLSCTNCSHTHYYIQDGRTAYDLACENGHTQVWNCYSDSVPYFPFRHFVVCFLCNSNLNNSYSAHTKGHLPTPFNQLSANCSTLSLSHTDCMCVWQLQVPCQPSLLAWQGLWWHMRTFLCRKSSLRNALVSSGHQRIPQGPCGDYRALNST